MGSRPVPPFLARHWFLLALAFAVAAPIYWPEALRPLHAFIDPAWNVAAVMLINGLTLDGRRILNSLRRPGRVLSGVLIGYAVVAVLGFGASRLLLETNRSLALGILVISAMPTTLASSIIWTRMARGNAALALVMVVASNGLGVLVTPLILFLTVGTFMTLSLEEMMAGFALVVLTPLALGQGLRRTGPVVRIVDRHARTLSNASRLLILLAVSGAVLSGVTGVETGRGICPVGSCSPSAWSPWLFMPPPRRSAGSWDGPWVGTGKTGPPCFSAAHRRPCRRPSTSRPSSCPASVSSPSPACSTTSAN